MHDLAAHLARISESTKSVRKDSKSGETLLLLTCIDLRYPALIHSMMEPNFHKLYDHVCLAGAGLAPVIDFGPDRKPHWEQTFLEHVGISVALHSIKSVIVMDHRDCGAYRKFGLLTDHDTNTVHEKDVHFHQMGRLKELLASQFPDLEFHGILLPVEAHKDISGSYLKELSIEAL